VTCTVTGYGQAVSTPGRCSASAASDAITFGQFVASLFAGMFGALVVFGLGQLALTVRDRWDFKSAVTVVLDEIETNLAIARSLALSVPPAPGDATVSSALSTSHYDSVKAVLARRLPDPLRKTVFRTYQYFQQPAFRRVVSDPSVKGALVQLIEMLTDTQGELNSYKRNLDAARIRRTKQVQYEAAPLKLPAQATGLGQPEGQNK